MKQVDRFLSLVDIEFKRKANPPRAEQMSAYMKDYFPFYGIQSKLRGDIFREICKMAPIKSIDEWWYLIDELYRREEREYHYLALLSLKKVQKKLIVSDIDKIEYLLLSHSWWDTVDFIASNTVGYYFTIFPYEKSSKIEEWMSSDEMWLQRTCLIFQLKYKEDVDFPLLKSCILRTKNSKEFFLEKGAGWALRQYSKFRPEKVRTFIESHSLPTITMREAKKYL